MSYFNIIYLINIIDKNFIEYEGAKYISEALQTNATLTTLNLSNILNIFTLYVFYIILFFYYVIL